MPSKDLAANEEKLDHLPTMLLDSIEEKMETLPSKVKKDWAEQMVELSSGDDSTHEFAMKMDKKHPLKKDGQNGKTVPPMLPGKLPNVSESNYKDHGPFPKFKKFDPEV